MGLGGGGGEFFHSELRWLPRETGRVRENGLINNHPLAAICTRLNSLCAYADTQRYTHALNTHARA